MFRLRLLLSLLILNFGLGACASMMEELLYRADNMGELQALSETLGLAVSKDDYLEARRLWPWADTRSLQRRALILALGPTPLMIRKLQKSQSEERELEMIQSLLVKQKYKKTLSKN